MNKENIELQEQIILAVNLLKERQGRIDKAIKYIEQGIYSDYGDRGLKAEEDLLNILKGEENE